ATLYRCASGRIPPAAAQREAAIAAGRTDPLPSLSGLLPPEFGGLADTIQAGLALDPRRRPQTAAAWRRDFFGQKSVPGPVDDEHREYLPAVLLAVFVAVMIGALGYLFWPDDAGDAASESETAQRSDEALRSPQEEAQWRAALNADSAYGYQRFMQDYPDSIHNDQALLHLERLDHQAWGKTRMDGSRAAVQAYLEQFPNGLHLADADILLNEIRLAEEAEQRRDEAARKLDDEDWERARAARTIGAVDQYLADWPGGTHADEARKLRAQLQSSLDDRRAFEAAAKLNTRDAYQAYIDAFPRGSKLAAALEAIDDLTLRPGKRFRDCAGCPDMMVLPAGSFWQGSEENSPLALKKETPRRMVSFQEPFAIGVFEVTFEQWDRCVAAGACGTNPNDNGWGRGKRPVMGVSWNDALEFTEWLSDETGQRYGLPSESQWEYAARAGEEGDWQGGAASRVCEYANIAGTESGFRWNHEDCADTAAMQTLPVGSLEPNAFGLYDTIGNVAEWTMDCMNLSYLDAPADGSAWNRGICSSRMTRGGSWFTGTREIRLPARFNLKNGDRNDFTGFRVVRKVDP
ncbi:MAG: SUMF1/EgtB/PvdO family nonheme iron enzyme, partial [Lysobacterales bacterium]